MKCPQLKIYTQDEVGDTKPGFADCLQGECAWWRAWCNSCVISQIAPSIEKLVDQLDRINDNIRYPLIKS